MTKRTKTKNKYRYTDSRANIADPSANCRPLRQLKVVRADNGAPLKRLGAQTALLRQHSPPVQPTGLMTSNEAVSLNTLNTE